MNTYRSRLHEALCAAVMIPNIMTRLDTYNLPLHVAVSDMICIISDYIERSV